MSQVTDFHHGLFFCFLNSFQGPSQGSFQFPLYGDSSAFGWLLSDSFHASKPVLPLSCSLTILLAAVYLPDLLIVAFLGSGTSSSQVLGRETHPLHA